MKSKTRTAHIDLDAILVEIGETGRYQIFYYTLFCVTVLFTSSSYLSYIFTAGQLDYRCKIPECDVLDVSIAGDTLDYKPAWLPWAVPTDSHGVPDRCSRYQPVSVHTEDVGDTLFGNSNNSCRASSFNASTVIRCEEFVFASDEVTIVNAFNVTCVENEWRLAVIGTLGYIAELIVLPVCAVLSDKYGRRPVLIATLLLSGISGLLKSFSTSYAMFAWMEFVTALVSGGTYMTIFVMAIEFSGPKRRVFSGTLISAIYSSSQVLAGVVAIFFHDFRTFLRVLFVPNFLVLAIVCLIPESVRWLLAKNHVRRARQTLLRAAKCNGVRLSDEMRESLYENHEIHAISASGQVSAQIEAGRKESLVSTRSATNPFLLALRSRSLLVRLANCLFCWFTNSFIYYGMNVHSVALAGNKYVNYILVNLVEVPAVFLASWLMERFGRKWVLCVCLLINGIACVVTEFIAIDDTVGRLVLYVVGKCGVTISFTVLYVFSSELFPTEMRHSFMNACSTFGSVGSMIAPMTPLLAHTWSALPLLMFGGSALISGLMVLLLPDTNHTKLPDTVEEAEDIGHKTDLDDDDDDDSDDDDNANNHHTR